MIIKFNNFKSFPNLKKNKLHELKLKRINLIYGLNNSGKSSIIQLLNLLSKNYEDYKFLRTNFEDIPLGQYENILNNSSDKNLGTYIELYEDRIANFRFEDYDFHELPKSGLTFHYNFSKNKNYKSTAEIKKFKIVFEYNKQEGKTFFEFDDEGVKGKELICKDINFKKNCIFFDFKATAKYASQNKKTLLNNVREANRAYKTAIRSVIKLNEALDNLEEFYFNKKNLELKKFLQIFRGSMYTHRRFDYLWGYKKDTRINKKITNEDKIVEFYKNEKISDLRFNELQELIGASKIFDTYNQSQIKTIKELNEIFKLILSSKILNSDDYDTFYIQNLSLPGDIKSTITKYLEDFQGTKLSKIYKDIIFDFLEIIFYKEAKLMKFIKKLDEYLKSFEEIKVSDTNFYIDQFYRCLGEAPKKYKLYLFLKVNYKNIENLIHYASDDGFIDNKKEVEFFEGLFKDCLKNNLILNDLSENIEFYGLENNLIQIIGKINQLEIDNLVTFNLSNLKLLLNRFTTVRPLMEITKVTNENCNISQRFYQINNFESINPNHRYNQSHIINRIYNDNNLLNSINNQLLQFGFDFKIGFKDQGSNLEGIIIPILLDKQNKFKGYIVDAGQAIKKIIPLMYHLNANFDSVVTLEEPEANIHPQYQANLANTIVQSLHKNNNELVIETHSELLILRFLKLIRDETINVRDISIHFIQNENNHSKIIPIKINSKGGLETEWPGGFFKERLKEFL